VSIVNGYEKMMKRIGNKYLLALIAGKRAESLSVFGIPEINVKSRNWATVALKEIEEGYVSLENMKRYKQQKLLPYDKDLERELKPRVEGKKVRVGELYK